MKNIIFLLAILIVGCHRKDEVKPVSKNGTLHLEFTGFNTTAIKSKLYINGGNGTVWDSTIVSYTATSVVKDTVFQGGQNFTFGAITTKPDGSSESYGNYTIKIKYNGVTLKDQAFGDNIGVSCNVALPFL